jgi:hypothetical protein
MESLSLDFAVAGYINFRPYLLIRREFLGQWLLVGINEVGLFALLFALLLPPVTKNLAKYLSLDLEWVTLYLDLYSISIFIRMDITTNKLSL